MTEQKSSSLLLGKFVAMVQALEESCPNQQKKGEDWGRELLPLFQTNFRTTFLLVGKILDFLPISLTLEQAEIVTVEEMKKLGRDILTYFQNNEVINPEEYIYAYNSYCYGEKPYPSDPSYNLGVIMATVTCMELAENEMSTMGIVASAEDIILFLEVNFSATIELVLKIISNLPKTALFNGKKIDIKTVIATYPVGKLEYFEDKPLDKVQFRRGYEKQLEFYKCMS